ncbi:uncharacterized protein LOC121864487 isoform X2 [Homarus americanus]|uniref:uncharacterized protein LOC121864487 isoform X2 n=1 Tax=Homarus americanus TaxID=6706 RepID=UPI001C440A61|nr:uncharacterized protein LOC121864487 isoform X2 [Homarus americanus]
MWGSGRAGDVLPLLLGCTWLTLVQAVVEEIEVDPSNTNGFELGELSFLQFVLGCVIFIKIVALYAVGVLPIEVDLGFNSDSLASRRTFTGRDMDASTFMLDCPMQFVCDVDAWANRDHQHLTERLIASWFRNPNHTWTKPDAQVFAGVGTCKEMYPCPFNVQDVVGFHIPGTNQLANTQEDAL